MIPPAITLATTWQHERSVAVGLAHLTDSESFGDLDRVHEALRRRQRSEGTDLPHREEEQDEEHVDKGCGRLEEVIVVGGDELAELVDERTKAPTADDRGDESRRGR